MKKISLLLPLSAVALLGLGCNPFAKVEQKINDRIAQGVVENVIEGSTGGKVDVGINKGGNAVTFRDKKTGDYTAWGEDAQIPDDFPSDVPRYAGAKTIGVMLKGDKKDASLTQTTTDSMDKVAAWIASQLEGAGYTEASTLDMGTGGKLTSYEKGTVKISATIAADSDDQKVTIALTRHEE